MPLSRPGRGEAEGSAFRLLPFHLPARPAGPKTHASRRTIIPIPTFKTEWWYYTGHLETESGKRYGYQVTFFRFGLRDRQKEMTEAPLFSELYMAHFALSDLAAKKFTFRERIDRGIAGKAGGSGYGDKAGAATDRFLVWNGDWKVNGDENDHADSSE